MQYQYFPLNTEIAESYYIYNKLHPDERKGTKDIVEEVCEYYIDPVESIGINSFLNCKIFVNLFK